MRVLVITNMYPPHHYGGYELSCRDVMERFRRRGHEVTVLTSTLRVPGLPAEPESEPEHGVHRSLAMYWQDHELLSPHPLRRVALERANRRRLARLLDAVRPQVVSVWNMGAMSLGLLDLVVERRVPLLLVVADDWLEYGPRLDAWSRLWQARPRAAAVAAVLTGLPTSLPDLRGAVGCFVSDFTRRRAEQEAHPRLRPAISAVVHVGIDPYDFPITETRDRPWQGRLLYVGRLDARKGIETVLRALAGLPGAQLRLVGPGPATYRDQLRDLARNLGVTERVSFDVVPRDALADVYREADALVFPPEWDEPFGLVPLEAMACGTPVVATATGGSAEFLVPGRNFLRFPPGDADALVAAVAELARDPGLRARLVAGGRKTAARLHVDAYADALESWHLATIDGFSRGRPPEHRLTVGDA